MSDTYVVVHIQTTCDIPGAFVSLDSAELCKLQWCTVDAKTLEILNVSSLLVKPTAATVAPTVQSGLAWELVKEGISFKDAITRFEESINELVDQKDFTFVTTDIHNLRVSLPREARDRSVVLPLYLQHPRVFDLMNEYGKWQLTHPEALSYPLSYLMNMVTALSVDVPDDWLSSESLDLVHPTVDIHARILAALVRKSLPVEAHPNVLTKPYDTAHDAKVFLAERLKILYLSNLPSDTTQLELEQWFTQFGGRPIAFWALKNVDGEVKLQNKAKGASGFAVFAKHEDAAQLLFMNGRNLNDRIVDVQASLTRVLDKASDLLTPFPLLKNRPRPGDWTCPLCGFSNFQRRIACFRCLFPATSAVVIHEQMFTPETNGQRRRNKHDDRQFAGNYDYQNGKNGYNYQYNLNNGNGNGNNNNNNNNGRMHYGNSVPFRAGDWKCTNENCQYHNFAKNLCCLKCGRAKPPTLNLNHHHGNGVNQQQNSHNHNHNAAAAAAAAAAAGSIHSVNSTAAAIAAATASGQPLNLSNSFLGLQQPQPQPQQMLARQNQNQLASSSPVHQGGMYQNISQMQQQYPYGQKQQKSQQSYQGHLPQLAYLQQNSLPVMGLHKLSSSSPGLYVQNLGYNPDNLNQLNNQINLLSLN